MSKKRVYELAKELGMTSKDTIIMLNSHNIDVKSHMAMLTAEEIKNVKDKLESEKITKDKSEEKKAKAKDVPKKKEVQKTKKQPQKQTKQKSRNKKQKKQTSKKDMPSIDLTKEVEIDSQIIVKDLSQKLGISIVELMGKLMTLGVMANQNQDIDFEIAELVASEFGRTVVLKESKQQLDIDSESGDIFGLDYEDKEEDLKERPPVITVMGHVDHGKTSLLDAIRSANVTRGEAGGITQHIGAYSIKLNNKTMVFLDTPGHEAFTTMRARGAMVTDIAILVVAADDGVMPQTIEAINHAKVAGVPIVVAINKMDLPGANPDRVKQELAEHEILPEEWGGETIMMEVSAKNNEGIDDLLEMVLMLAEMEELKSNPNRPGIGTIIEAELDTGRGAVATIIVEKGTFNATDMVVSGSASGRIRAMYDDKFNLIKKAGPSMPIQIQGLSDVPNAGDKIFVVEDERTARMYADLVKEQERTDMMQAPQGVSLDDLFARIQEGGLQDLNIIVKTDVRGTIDAVKQSFEQMSNDEVRVNIIHGAAGGITPSDVQLATASNAIIIGFNVRPSQLALDMAKDEDIDIRTYRVIYEAIDDIEAAIKGMLAPEYVEEVIGRAEVREVFRVPNAGNVAGIYVRSGKITRNASVRLLRNDVVVFEGDISSLKRFKDDVREVAVGYEGGLGIENYNDVKVNDIIEAYVMKEVER